MRGPVFLRLFETPLLVRVVVPQAGLQEDVGVRACAHVYGPSRSRGGFQVSGVALVVVLVARVGLAHLVLAL
jgi:hypothetical protein